MTLTKDTVILYVEDDKRSRKVMKLMTSELMKLKNVTIFEDSENFIFRVEALSPKPDVILLDIHVPPLDGFEMLKLLRKHEDFKETPIVALTASVMNEEVHRLKNAGFNGVIAKPINPDRFEESLEKIMNGKSVWAIIG